MFQGKKVGVVVPCYNEERLVKKVVDTMPEFVDVIYLVDDASEDTTPQVLEGIAEQCGDRIKLCLHSVNQGVGGAIASGYKLALEDDVDAVAVMAGDAQMDPDDLPALLEPVVSGAVDYSKGNRLFTGDAWNIIPKVRYLGNSFLSLLTKVASGYWHVADSQSGYTVISRRALKAIDWDLMYKRYGQPNDQLVRLNIEGFKVRDVPIRPVYNIGEKSGIKPIRMIPRLAWLLFRLFLFRMFHKYVIRDFHPLVFFYLSALVILPVGLLLGGYLLYYRLAFGPVSETSALFSAFLTITGLQFLFFGMSFDMENNKELK
jgi:glycosyltransferase involved in cell wall biosynthesis